MIAAFLGVGLIVDNKIGNFQIISVPIMAWRTFAAQIGTESEIVRGMCQRGYLPTLKIGKHRYINLVALAHACLEQSTFELPAPDDDL